MAAGADIIELGFPYSDPLADGPVIQAAGTRALEAGTNVAAVLEIAERLSHSVPVVAMCYANMVFAPGASAFVERLQRSGASGLIVPDLPYGASPEVARGVRAARDRARAAGGAHHAAGPPARDRVLRPRVRVRGLGGRHDRRARPRCRTAPRG